MCAQRRPSCGAAAVKSAAVSVGGGGACACNATTAVVTGYHMRSRGYTRWGTRRVHSSLSGWPGWALLRRRMLRTLLRALPFLLASVASRWVPAGDTKRGKRGQEAHMGRHLTVLLQAQRGRGQESGLRLCRPGAVSPSPRRTESEHKTRTNEHKDERRTNRRSSIGSQPASQPARRRLITRVS